MIEQISMYLLRVKKKWVDVAIKETNIPTGMSRIRGRLKYFKKSSNLEAFFQIQEHTIVWLAGAI